MKVRVFTDGACSENPGPGGWAAVFNSEDSCTTISGYEAKTTNNRMELKSVVESIKKLLVMKANDCELYSDSAYVINAINGCWIEKWKANGWKTTKLEDVKNKSLWVEFFASRYEAQRAGVRIKFIKVKGHNGNTFNEMADKLARAEVIKAKEENVK